MSKTKTEVDMKIDVEMKAIFKNSSSPLKATANIVIGGCFVVHNVKLIDNGNGMFIAMPSFRRRDGVWLSVCHPITRECREVIQTAVIEEYEKQ